ncbi:NAD(P)-binding protein [Dipodascopsis uninucleata]
MSSRKILAVIGATGNQGGSVIDYVLSSKHLSEAYSIRALTRDITKPEAQTLRCRGAEIVRADINDEKSLDEAFSGVHTVFAMTAAMFNFPKFTDAKEVEIAQGHRVADAAVRAGVGYLIWSTSTNVTEMTGQTLSNVVFFDAKALVEEYIRTLPIKSAFYAPGSFFTNFQRNWLPRPIAGDGTYSIATILKPESRLPMIDIDADTGKYIGAVLTEPDKFAGQVLYAGTMYSMGELADLISKHSGKTVNIKTVPDDTFKGFLPTTFREPIYEMSKYFLEYGYYGKDTAERTEATAKLIPDKLTSFEEFLEKNTIKF